MVATVDLVHQKSMIVLSFLNFQRLPVLMSPAFCGLLDFSLSLRFKTNGCGFY